MFKYQHPLMDGRPGGLKEEPFLSKVYDTVSNLGFLSRSTCCSVQWTGSSKSAGWIDTTLIMELPLARL